MSEVKAMMKAWKKRDHKKVFLKLSSRLNCKHYLMTFNLILNAMKRKKNPHIGNNRQDGH